MAYHQAHRGQPFRAAARLKTKQKRAPRDVTRCVAGIVSYMDNACLKFELMGCEEPAEEPLLGYDYGYSPCVGKSQHESSKIINIISYTYKLNTSSFHMWLSERR